MDREEEKELLKWVECSKRVWLLGSYFRFCGRKDGNGNLGMDLENTDMGCKVFVYTAAAVELSNIVV